MEGKLDLLNFSNEKSIYKEFKAGGTLYPTKSTCF
jgi:hypothetical protein